MARVTIYYRTAEEKDKLISDILKLENHKVITISKEYQGKGKSLYKRRYIDLSQR